MNPSPLDGFHVKNKDLSAALLRTNPANILLLANFHFGNSSAAF